jgi:hypothetical protein
MLELSVSAPSLVHGSHSAASDFTLNAIRADVAAYHRLVVVTL